MGAKRPGGIFGNIEIAQGDAIEVSSGPTLFNGIVNPDPATPTGRDTGEREGALSIFGDGELVLANRWCAPDCPQPPSFVNVDAFSVAPDGALGLEIKPSDAPGDYPQVFANRTDLDGTLRLRPRPGLYA
ncbi:MAG: hypothetical protein ACOC91_00165, partial [bacterium]